MHTPEAPDFCSASFLNQHVHSILDFYEANARANDGGFHQCFLDDGSVYDRGTRHLVSSTRFVINYANAYRHYNTKHYREWARSGLDFLTRVHRQPAGHYAWLVQDGIVTDNRAMAYGHAFVMLAASSCLQAGIAEAEVHIDEIWQLMESHFWEPDFNAYADERNGTLDVLDDYRGQNANMHMCEALIAAFEATGLQRYLDRACQLAQRFAIDLASAHDGLIWEHYDVSWKSDMLYNIDKPDDLFKPWGFQPGHQVEWSKLLLQLNQHKPTDIWVRRAIELFDTAMTKGWDNEHGGLVYGIKPDNSFASTDKYFWVHAEAQAAAWRLYKVTQNTTYVDYYNLLWNYSWQHLIDHQHGAWFRVKRRDGGSYDTIKSPPGKTDYHTMGACWDTLHVL